MDTVSTSRRFLTYEDFFGDPDQEDDMPDTGLYTAFSGILEGIVTPIFAEVYPELDGVEVSNIQSSEGNVLEFHVTGYHNMPNELDKATELADLMTEFAGKKQQILNGVQWAIYPTMRESLLEQYDLSEEQFLVKTVKVNVEPRLTSYYSSRERGGNYLGDIYLRITVVFSLTIEDISTMEPGGEETLRLRLENLCSSTSRYPLKELQDWAKSLGAQYIEDMTREELCSFVRSNV